MFLTAAISASASMQTTAIKTVLCSGNVAANGSLQGQAIRSPALTAQVSAATVCAATVQKIVAANAGVNVVSNVVALCIKEVVISGAITGNVTTSSTAFISTSAGVPIHRRVTIGFDDRTIAVKYENRTYKFILKAA